MSRKANMRQNSIITLSDQCKKEIDDLRKQKETLMTQYDSKKKELNDEFLGKQSTLNRIKAEIEDMSQFKELKERQTNEIDLLEKEISEARQDQTAVITELRTQFLREKNEFKRDADNRIVSIVRAANREARECLNENTYRIKVENQKLRGDIFELIQMTKDLSEHKAKLEKQKEELINEIKYTEDLKKVRSTQQQRVLEKMFANSSEQS
jgi:chromosome segregation ATPase